MRTPKANGQQSSRGSERSRRTRPQTWRHGRSQWFAFSLLALAATLMSARLSSAPGSQPGAQHGPQLDGPPLTLTIRVYNYAKVSQGSIRLAESEAARIIGGAGVGTVWLDCPTSRRLSLPAPGGGQQECSGLAAGATVELRVLNRSDYDSTTLNREVFGYSDGPVLASVLYDRVAAFANADGDTNEAPVILGTAMAHEMGHLLLGPRAHSPTGIMRGQWDRAQLQRALKGRQRFTPDQSARIRAAMEARMKL